MNGYTENCRKVADKSPLPVIKERKLRSTEITEKPTNHHPYDNNQPMILDEASYFPNQANRSPLNSHSVASRAPKNSITSPSPQKMKKPTTSETITFQEISNPQLQTLLPKVPHTTIRTGGF